MNIYLLPADWYDYLICDRGPVPTGVEAWLREIELPRSAILRVEPHNAVPVWHYNHDGEPFRHGCECLPYLVDDRFRR